ncbi:MAG TPA: TolC family protein [Chitinophagaceae bacterium]
MTQFENSMCSYRKYLLLPLLLITQFTWSQELTLDSAYAMARNNYPLIRQRELIRQTAALSVENLSKGYLPQLSVSGQGTYQSDVTKVEIPVPGLKVNPLSKDQYKLVADVSQLLYDGGAISAQQELQKLNAVSEDQKLEVELYKLRDRVNQLYLGILLLDQQISQAALLRSDLSNGLRKVEAQVINGVALRSALSSIKADSLKTEQKITELAAARKSLVDILSLFTGRELPQGVKLAEPLAATAGKNITRPELDLFHTQQSILRKQRELLKSRNLPKALAFAQGGYGRPGLNMLKNEFDWFYILGLRLNWTLSGLYTYRNDKKLLEIGQRTIALQEETFLLNTNSQLLQQESEIAKYEQLIASDLEIIELRKNVKDAALAQLSNGVITSADYLREVNAEDQARTTMIVHRLQLLNAKINYQTITGK